MTTSRTAQTAPIVKAPGEGTAIWHTDTLMTFKALSEETGGRLAAWEQLLPRGQPAAGVLGEGLERLQGVEVPDRRPLAGGLHDGGGVRAVGCGHGARLGRRHGAHHP